MTKNELFDKIYELSVPLRGTAFDDTAALLSVVALALEHGHSEALLKLVMDARKHIGEEWPEILDWP